MANLEMTLEMSNEEWDKIFQQRKEYEKQNPKLKVHKRYKTYKNQDGNTGCTKCGRTSEIGTCSDCIGEKEYLQIA